MKRKQISSGSPTEELAKYSRAILDDGWLYVSGTMGIDPETLELPDSAKGQTYAIFRIIEDTLKQADMSLVDVLRCRVFLTDRSYLTDVIHVLAEKFDTVRPANTTVICQLPVPNAKVEIEITARKPCG
jgi:enamine deaminase RidA (YjgF/YER057c/UK114 family)